MHTDGKLHLRPLSTSQSGIWFAQMLIPQNPVYNMAEYHDIQGPIQPECFEAALRQAVAETDTLHLRILETDEGPQQYIEPAPDWLLPVLDVSAETNPQAAAEAWMRQELSRTIDLTQGPLFAYALFRVAPDRYFWYTRYHHICMDGLSMALVTQRVAALYAALVAGQSVTPETPGSYFDLLDDEMHYRQSTRYERDRAYWQQQMADRPDPVTISGQPPTRAEGMLRCSDWLSRALIDALVDIGHANGASLPQVITAVAGLYQHRLTGERNLTLGTVVTGRSGARMRRIAGMASNEVPLRLWLDSEARFVDVLTQVSRRMREALRHQRYSAEDLRHDAGLLPDDPELYGTVVNVNAFDYDLRFDRYPARTVNIGNVAVEDLQIMVYDRQNDNEICLELVGNPAHYSAASLADHLRRFVFLLHQLVQVGVDVPLYGLDLVDRNERVQLLETFNTTAHTVPEVTVVELFEAQVARAPEALAVIFGETAMSYGELNAQSNRLAHTLIALGVGPEVLVGVSLERSLELITTLVAILKAGGVYVPMDTDLPAMRRDRLVTDAGLRHLITNRSHRDLYDQSIEHVIILDGDDVHRRHAGDDNPAVMLLPQQPAYVNYTSGSTGQPKGVLIPHQAIVRLVWEPTYVELNSSSRLLQLAPLSFDAATFEIWGALLNGGSLVMMPPGPLSIEEIGAIIKHQQVETLWLTSGLFNQMVDGALPGLSGVCQLLAGGDVLSPEHVRKVQQIYPDCQVINGYGPTENTTFSTCYAVPQETELSHGVPIGFPIGSTWVYVLDAGLGLAPVGVVGELYLAGAGLARGYLRQAGLTAERFVADPHGTEPGSRMYRTGDLVRWRTDGALEFMGRGDDQVKIRGFRIELGEIESVLAAHESVSQAAVIVRDEDPNEKQLVAYVVLSPGARHIPSALRHMLGERLPAYMVPSAVVTLEILPLNRNGKLDRRALPMPARQTERYQAPRTPEEQILCDLFAGVLSLERVGVHDNFFALGGQSLLAMSLVSRIRATFGAEMAIRTLFEASTVSELAPQLRSGALTRPPLVPQARPQRLPLSYAQFRLWFFHQLEGPSATYNIPLTLHLEGSLDLEALEQAIVDVVGRHESLRTVFREIEGEPFQHILAADEARVRLQLEPVSESALGDRLLQTASSVLDLGSSLPLQCWVFRLSRERHVVLLLLHHVAADGWSLAPLARDLSLAYEARLAGRAPDFVPLPVQYGDYTLWQRAHLGQEDDPTSALSEQLAFWQQALAGLPQETDLPTDRPRPAVPTYRGSVVPVQLGAELHRDLQALAQENGATLFMVLQAGLAALLSRLGGGDDLAIGTPIAGRGEAALDDLVGFFVNTLVLRTDVSGQPSFVELLGRVRAFALEAYAHAEVPFERVVDVLEPERSLSRHPLFQVMLVVQNTPMETLTLSGLEVRVEPLEGVASKFDLTLSLSERHGPDGERLGLEGTLEYSEDLFDRRTAESLVVRLERLLTSAVSTPGAPVYALELLSASERLQALEGFNDTAHGVSEFTMVEVFETRVARAPEAPAVIMGELSVSYAELNAQANRLAHVLIALGVGPEQLVGVCLERSVEFVVALLGILKAGGAYMPLDPAYPHARLAYMLTDASPVVTLSSAALRECLPETVPVMILDATDFRTALAQAPEHNPTDHERHQSLLPVHLA
ncbi:MAG: hypothetical protein ETSY2_05370, partial [Candidatus Entotheonella gemina]